MLMQIAKANRVAMGLHLYLARFHYVLFRRRSAQAKDYAVAYYDEGQAEAFLLRFDRDRKNLPRPQVDFFADKQEALAVISSRPYSAFSWRRSPKLALMY